MKLKITLASIIALIGMIGSLTAKENVGQRVGVTPPPSSYGNSNKVMAPCASATAQAELDINNIRTTINANGDLWWDLTNAKYEVPKQDPPNPSTATHSIFAGALWIGGIDDAGQLKIAAQTYRQTGNDFWTGPLVASKGYTVEQEDCQKFDKLYKINGAEILQFKAYVQANGGSITEADLKANFPAVANWPARNNIYMQDNEVILVAPNQNLAPFVNLDSDPLSYDPTKGDYPALDDSSKVIPDQMIFFIANDRGNIHSESGSDAIGLQLRSIAFAFSTNDDINNMTFYKYKVDYFGSAKLNKCYFGVWVDPDLGCYDDDFVGCDTTRSLGICYNGDNNDDVSGCGMPGYGTELPMLGIDFFKGPADENGNILGASGFVYYNNDFSVRGNPENINHFYNYLSGYWKNGSPFTCGGTAFGGTSNCRFMFPSDPNITTAAGGWSECAIPNTPADRRFLHVAGPFNLLSGASNEVIIGAVWVRPVEHCSTFDKIGQASDKAQDLFDNNFKLKDGPFQPKLAVRELDQKLSFLIYNPVGSNNINETYNEADPLIPKGLGFDTTYNFEGYKVYQFQSSSVSSTDISNSEKARLVFQCDKKNNIKQIVNYVTSEIDGYPDPITIPVPKLEQFEDKGISHSFLLENDAFSGNKLINQKTYYYFPIAYAYNNFAQFDPNNTNLTQSTPYIESRKSVEGSMKTYAAIPHKTNAELNGTVLNCEFGDAPEITRIDGKGNNGLWLELTEESEATILANDSLNELTYKAGYGPVEIKVFDPTKIPAHKFELELQNDPIGSFAVTTSARWVLKNLTTGDIVNSETTIANENEQACPTFDQSTSWGFTINITQTSAPGTAAVQSDGNGIIGSEVIYKDATKNWLSGLQDGGTEGYTNWIRSGTYDNASTNCWDSYIGRDPNNFYEDIVDGTWAPYCMTSSLRGGITPPDDASGYAAAYGTAYNASISTSGCGVTVPLSNLLKLPSVDIVFTSDTTKWTQCVVIEMGEESAISEGNAAKFTMRKHKSWNKNGTYASSETGRSWFPGYAIDLETGKRLNIIFGENSFHTQQNGTDMIWNPTNRENSTFGGVQEPVIGGMHYIYVMDSKYDKGQRYHNLFTSGAATALTEIYRQALWVSMAMLSPGQQLLSVADGIIPTETRVKLRVQRPYERYFGLPTLPNMPKYQFDFSSMAAKTADVDAATSALDLINIVPNPYFAFSTYENSTLDTKVYLTNLPSNCKIKIFNLSGNLIRQYDRNDNSDGTVGDLNWNTVQWDLQNYKGVPISSGMYIIHIDAGDLGERTLKFMAVMRPTDVTNF